MGERDADAVRRMSEALAGASEDERAEVLRKLGAKERAQVPRKVLCTPLPGPRREPNIVLSVEWE